LGHHRPLRLPSFAGLPIIQPTGHSHGAADLGLYENLLSTIVNNVLQFKLAEVFTKAEVGHWFLLRQCEIPAAQLKRFKFREDNVASELLVIIRESLGKKKQELFSPRRAKKRCCPLSREIAVPRSLQAQECTL
jgi:hypothetical protein